MVRLLRALEERRGVSRLGGSISSFFRMARALQRDVKLITAMIQTQIITEESRCRTVGTHAMLRKLISYVMNSGWGRLRCRHYLMSGVPDHERPGVLD